MTDIETATGLVGECLLSQGFSGTEPCTLPDTGLHQAGLYAEADEGTVLVLVSVFRTTAESRKHEESLDDEGGRREACGRVAGSVGWTGRVDDTEVLLLSGRGMLRHYRSVVSGTDERHG